MPEFTKDQRQRAFELERFDIPQSEGSVRWLTTRLAQAEMALEDALDARMQTATHDHTPDEQRAIIAHNQGTMIEPELMSMLRDHVAGKLLLAKRELDEQRHELAELVNGQDL